MTALITKWATVHQKLSQLTALSDLRKAHGNSSMLKANGKTPFSCCLGNIQRGRDWRPDQILESELFYTCKALSTKPGPRENWENSQSWGPHREVCTEYKSWGALWSEHSLQFFHQRFFPRRTQRPVRRTCALAAARLRRPSHTDTPPGSFQCSSRSRPRSPWRRQPSSLPHTLRMGMSRWTCPKEQKADRDLLKCWWLSEAWGH